MRVETKRLILRAPQARDTEDAVGFFASERAKFVGGPMPKGRAWRHVAAVAGHWLLKGFGPFVMADRASGRGLGLAGPWAPGDRPEPEIVWGLWDAAPKGVGLAKEAASAALNHIFTELAWPSVVAYVGRDNQRSQTLAAALGGVLDPDAPRPDADTLVYRYRPAGGTP